MPLPKAPKQRASRLDASSYANDLSPSSLTAPPVTPPPAATTAEVVQLPTPVARAAGSAPTSPAKAAKPPKIAAAPKAASSTRSRKPTGPTKLFVLDTNVLMHDPMCIFRFEEHDVFLPMITLEELDGHKKGMTEVARNVRQVSRDLDTLAASLEGAGVEEMAKGLLLGSTGHREALGRLFFQTQPINTTLPQALPQGKADNQILAVVQSLKDQHPGREVVLVSKDINMRIKARALGLPAEDYRNDKALEDSDLLYTGVLALPADFWERHGKTMESWQQGGTTFYRISGPLVPSLLINQLVYLEAPGATPLYAKVTEITGKSAVLKTLKDYGHQKHSV